MTLYLQKSSGEREPFILEKFTQSLKKAGADDALVAEITATIQEKLPSIGSTKQLYGIALNYLQDKNPVVACRYNLKQALFLLGPTGFPFEQFIAHIFAQQGYQVTTDQILQGKCVEHEVDVVGSRNHHKLFVECKFHHAAGIKVDVTIPLYVKSRFDDIAAAHHDKHDSGKQEVWVATNVKFTSEAVLYAQCVGIHLLGWSYPANNNLQLLIDRYGLHPVTALPNLSTEQKKYLVDHGLVFCRDAAHYQHLFADLGLSQQEIAQSINDCRQVCRIGQ